MMAGPSVGAYCDAGGLTQKVSTRSGVKPARRSCIPAKLLRSKPALASSSSASATSLTTRPASSRRWGPPAPLRSSSFSAVTRSAREVWSAGASPNNRLVPRVIASANNSTVRSIDGVANAPIWA